jgi:hypothetical protein
MRTERGRAEGEECKQDEKATSVHERSQALAAVTTKTATGDYTALRPARQILHPQSSQLSGSLFLSDPL